MNIFVDEAQKNAYTRRKKSKKVSFDKIFFFFIPPRLHSCDDIFSISSLTRLFSFRLFVCDSLLSTFFRLSSSFFTLFSCLFRGKTCLAESDIRKTLPNLTFEASSFDISNGIQPLVMYVVEVHNYKRIVKGVR